MLNKEWASIALLVMMFGMAFYFQFAIPVTGDVVVTARDELGNPLDTGNRFAVLFALPVIAFALYLLLNALPHVAVYKRNIERFYQRFYGFKFILLLFVLLVYIINVLPAYLFTVHGVANFDTHYIFVPALAGLFFYMGRVLKHIHRNYFIGFLTPWALSSDKLWDKTHHFGGAVLEVCAVFLLLGLVFREYLIQVMLAAVISVVLVTFFYSYLIFTRSHHHHHR